MDKSLTWRRAFLERVPSLAGRYTRLSRDEATALCTFIVDQLVRGGSGPDRASWRVRTTNIYEMQPPDLRLLLSQLPLGRQVVEVVWPFDQAAIRIDYADFVEHYDDLWYPSRDDVWALSSDQTITVGIDHEEVVLIAEALVG